MLFKFLAIIVIVSSVFFKAETKFLHPKFKGMILEKSFDESSGELALVSCLKLQPTNQFQTICRCSCTINSLRQPAHIRDNLLEICNSEFSDS